MCTGISITVLPADRRRLEAVVKNGKRAAEARLALPDRCARRRWCRHERDHAPDGKSKTCVWRWQERFAQDGFEGLLRDKTRPSRSKPLGEDVAARIVALTLDDPPGETTHWTRALMAKAASVSVSSVQRIWRAHGLQPHRVRQFKLSDDPKFVDKLRDVIGLYVDPPAHAIVLSVDENSQIQALDRTQPGLPLKKGCAGAP